MKCPNCYEEMHEHPTDNIHDCGCGMSYEGMISTMTDAIGNGKNSC